jgi:hypothetical protein
MTSSIKIRVTLRHHLSAVNLPVFSRSTIASVKQSAHCLKGKETVRRGATAPR